MSTAENILQYLRAVDNGKASQSEVTAVSARVTANEGDIATLQGTVSGHTTDIATNAGNITANDGEITALDGRVTSLETATTALDDLSNVVITTPADTEVLTYNAGNWVNSAAAGGSMQYYRVMLNTAATFAAAVSTPLELAGTGTTVTTSGGFTLYNTVTSGIYIGKNNSAIQVPEAGIWQVTVSLPVNSVSASAGQYLVVNISRGDAAGTPAYINDSTSTHSQINSQEGGAGQWNLLFSACVEITTPATEQIHTALYKAQTGTMSFFPGLARLPVWTVHKVG